MLKQRRDSITQYNDANRRDLAEIEEFEAEVIKEFLPQALSEAEVSDIVAQAVVESGAQSMQDMGKVMAIVKPKIQGRGDMAAVSKLVKAQLG